MYSILHSNQNKNEPLAPNEIISVNSRIFSVNIGTIGFPESLAACANPRLCLHSSLQSFKGKENEKSYPE